MMSDDTAVLCVWAAVIALFANCRCNSVVNVIVPDERDELLAAVTNLQNVRAATMKSPNRVELETDIAGKSDDHLKFVLQRHVRSLRCTYMLNALQHMRLTSNLLVHNRPDWTETVALIGVYRDGVAAAMIETLYALGVRELNLLWMFYMYVDGVSAVSPTHRVIASTVWSMQHRRDVPNVYAVHRKVMAELVKYTTAVHCRNNVYAFERAEYKVDGCAATDPAVREACANTVKELVLKNFNSVRDLMRNNENHGVVARRDPAFHIDRLYLNDAVRSAEFMGPLTGGGDAFGVHTDWADVWCDLVGYNGAARDLNELKDNIWLMVRAYHVQFYNFVKLLVLRMARKHLKYQTHYDGFGKVWTEGKRVKYAKYTTAIKEVLTDFIELLGLRHRRQEVDELREVLDAVEQTAFKYKLKGRLHEALSVAKKKEKSLVARFNGINTRSLSTGSRKPVAFDMAPFVRKHNITVDAPFPVVPVRPIELNLIKMKILHRYLAGNEALKYIDFEVIAAFMSSQQ